MIDQQRDNEQLFDTASSELVSGNEEKAIEMFEALALTDWLGSYMLGYIYQRRGNAARLMGQDGRANYELAVEWYQRSLSQKENCFSHYGMARDFYYGLSADADYARAFEHLQKSCLESEPIAKAMMAELLSLGLGTKKDLEQAKLLFSQVAESSYPAGWLGLQRIAKYESRKFWSIWYLLKGFFWALKLVVTDRNDSRLAGVGGRWGDFRLGYVARERKQN